MKTIRNKQNKGFSIIDAIIAIVITIAVISILTLIIFIPSCQMMGGLNIDYSEGSRKGTVYKISKKGLIWDTYEGELSLGLTTANSEGQLVNQIFNFSVQDEQVAKQIEEAMLKEKKVKLTYKEYLVRGYKYGGTGYDVIKIEIIED